MEFIKERDEERRDERLREVVVASQLALVNVTLALDADKDVENPDNQKMKEAERKRKMRKAYESQMEFRAFIHRLRTSPVEYARYTGYAKLFGVEEPVREKPKTAQEKISRGYEAAKRALVKLFGSD